MRKKNVNESENESGCANRQKMRLDWVWIRHTLGGHLVVFLVRAVCHIDESMVPHVRHMEY